MEMSQLKQLDTKQCIRFVNIHNSDFSTQFPHIDKHAAYDLLHVEKVNGDLLLGLDASCAVWNAVGKHRWLNLLRLPLIKLIADLAYLFFARNRGTFARLITGRAHCDSCQI